MKKISALAFMSAIALLPSAAHAAGFALNEESAAVMGTADAGVAVTDEPAVQFTNPAGIAGQGTKIEIGGTLYRIDVAGFNHQGTKTLVGTPVTGSESSDDQLLAAPSFYYTHQLTNDLTLGVGIYSPFGLATEYSPSWVGRYESIETHVNTTELSPVLAYQINKQIAVGAGPTIRYSEAKLTQAVDFGSIGAADHLATTPQSSDGFAKLEGDGLGFGYKFGATYKPTDETTLGFGYRSRMTTALSGKSSYGLSTVGQAISTATGTFTTTNASANLNTPQSANLSLAQKITDPLTLYGDVMWTGWSTFQQLQVVYDNPAQPTTTIAEKWHDTARVSIGVGYDLTSQWTLRTGYAYDESPVKNATYTTARVPDGDRHWLAFGAGYKATSNLRIDAAYDHLFIGSAASDNVATNATTLVGTWDAVSADLFTLNATYAF